MIIWRKVVRKKNEENKNVIIEEKNEIKIGEKNKKNDKKVFMFGIRDDKIKKLKDFDKKYTDKVIEIF